MNRTLMACKALGYQGGTVHQIAKEIGVSVQDFLYAELPTDQTLNSDFASGWFAARTCDLAFNKRVNFPANHGNLNFWLGVVEGMALQERMV